MIDLHTHTNYSDGTWTLKELLKNAELNNITTLSITDHDTVKAYKELKNINYSSIFSGRIITGAEFNVVFNNSKVELLGYDFDIDIIDNLVTKVYSDSKNKLDLNDEFKILMEACRKNNVIVDDIEYNASMGWPIDYIFASLKNYPDNKSLFSEKEWNDIDHFFRCCTCNMDFPLYIDFSNHIPNAKLISDAIRNAGGKVFIAHLFTYPLRDYIGYLDKLREENIIDGIEVYYSTFTTKQIDVLKKYCKKYNLLMSVGSDCHGDKKPDRKIGVGYGNMNYTEDIIEDWNI